MSGRIQMRNEKVPIDMSSEQKDILGLLSKRQLGYIAVGGLILYWYVPLIYKLVASFGTGWMVAAVTALCSAAPTAAIIFFFGFVKVEKHNMNRDYYYWIMLQKRTQYGSWRKGP